MSHILADFVAFASTHFPPEEEVLEGILHPDDRYQHVRGHGTHSWYHALGAFFRPRSILEIGVLYGYSLWALAKGSGLVERVCAIDDQEQAPLSWMRQHFFERWPDVVIDTIPFSTREVSNLAFSADLAHLDAEHTDEGIYLQLRLAYPCMIPGGVILVDDVGEQGNGPLCRQGALRFVHEHGLECHFLNNHNGLYVIPIPREVT